MSTRKPKGKGPHVLRHTFCSHLARRGASAKAIQELAGHRDLATTQRYMHVSPSALDAAIALLEPQGVKGLHRDTEVTANTYGSLYRPAAVRCSANRTPKAHSRRTGTAARHLFE